MLSATHQVQRQNSI